VISATFYMDIHFFQRRRPGVLFAIGGMSASCWIGRAPNCNSRPHNHPTASFSSQTSRSYTPKTVETEGGKKVKKPHVRIRAAYIAGSKLLQRYIRKKQVKNRLPGRYVRLVRTARMAGAP